MTGDDLRTAGYNFLFLFNNSRRDVCGPWVWVAYLLCRNAGWLGRLRRTGNPAESSTLARRIVLESLRLRQSEFLWRIVTGDIHFDGMFLPEGATIRVCVREAHLNPVYFPDPDRFDPDRFLAPAWPPRAFAPFGIGQHGCIGQQLTLGVTSRFVESMAEFHWRLAGDGPPIHPSARGHWQPSDRFRVGIAATDRQT